MVTGTNLLCNNDNSGSINLTVTGGTPTYLYAWSNLATTEDLTGLAAGNYTVLVTDANGCTTNAFMLITQPSVLVVSNTSTPEITGNDGTIDLTVAGGTAGYTYVWSNGPSSQDQTGLTAGTYTVIVTDANGCLAYDTVLVSSNIGVEDLFEVNIMVYPNPTTNVLTIEIDRPMELTLLNAIGQSVLKINLMAGKNTIVLENILNGIYFLNFENENSVLQKKIVVNKN
jgi:hypothetical protein